jgi:hypothetical protein
MTSQVTAELVVTQATDRLGETGQGVADTVA